MDLDVARYMLTDSSQRNSNKENVVADSPVKKALNEIVFQNRTRILAFKSRPPAPAESVCEEVFSDTHQVRSTKP
ncbi:hypothetical protein AMTR_s00064p00056010 [Amborella trichopoda]|uniref:Uncharacterized protein n=2 Tax=Amborella trichopoda TaxID=13333 RepID=U5DB57_AMBTC|nr:hypothetical protein AMTR_s00064p00056010 [Amborella trichopoda]